MLLKPPPDIIETRRLILRKPQPDDAPLIFSSYATDPEVTRYLLFRPDQKLQDVENFLQKAIAAWGQGTSLTWVIALRTENVLLGMIDVRLDGEANLGYVLARPYWNRGYMTEAIHAVVEWALGQEQIHRVWAVCEVGNLASARVLEKAGFQREGLLKEWMVFPNLGERPRDCFQYGISRDPSPKV
jgi:[ribosomal protein S5]-alanine N-acetyltransferase